MHGLEDCSIGPGLKYSSTCQVTQVNPAFHSVRIPEPDSVTTEWPYFDCFLRQ